MIIGQKVSHYKILEKMGGGGMGVVYKAEDLRLGRLVALKFLSRELEQESQMVERFQREARAASALSHPHICTVYEIDEYEGQRFIAMELLEGQTLKEVLESGPRQPEQVLEWGVQIADALETAHGRGIIHRDVKPANIFITAQGQVKVLDFGLAKLSPHKAARKERDISGASTGSHEKESLTVPGMPVGTLAYMSPEQARGEEVDARTDVFSFGAVLYEMATGQTAFGGSTPALTLDAILNRDPVPVAQLNPRVPVALDQIIRRALDKDRKARYLAAAAVREDLTLLRRENESRRRSLVTLNLTGWCGPSRFTGRRSRLAAFAVSALIVVGIVAVFLGLNPGGLRERILGGGGPRRIDSLAVLPLENVARDPEQDYFADGMTEALITDLAKIDGLKVISRTSVMRYKGMKGPLPEIASELNVDAVVEGSVLKDGNRVRITAQLIDAATDRHLWAETYEREFDDVLALQRDVARAVATQVRNRLTPRERDRLAAARPVDPAAYEAYLRGRYHWNKRSLEGLEKSIEYFQQAIRADPDYALAHAGLADAYVIMGVNDYGALRPREAMARAEAAAKRALQLDETLGEAQASLAIARFSFEWDWPEAERRYKQAIELNPNYATAHHWYAFFLAAMGRHEEAIVEIHKARELDPLSLIINANTGWILYLARRYDEALRQFQGTLEMDPEYGVARIYLGLAYEQLGESELAINQFRGLIAKEGASPPLHSALGHAYGLAGNTAQARKVVRELEERSRREYVPPHLIARVYAGLGEKDKSMEWLRKAYIERIGDLVFVNVDPTFDPLRSDSRFQDLLRRMDFPE